MIFHAAALKQAPTCEYFPDGAVMTNVMGPENLVRAISDSGTSVGLVVGISTDKACKLVNVMGMTKSIREYIFIESNLETASTGFI